ncbi:MAG TPA: Hpt domain-containing protein, partial [Blastocatellia bacterium]
MMDKALLSDYLSESEQLLDTLSSDLDLLVERAKKSRDSKDSSKANDEGTVETVNRVFRSVHSLKGLMGMMGLTDLQALAHRFESALDDIRLGKLRLNPELAAALQEVAESTIALYASEARRLQVNAERQPAASQGLVRLGKLLNNLAALPRTKPNKGSRSLASLRLSDQEVALLSPYERHRIAENLTAGKVFFEVCVEFQVSALDSRYRALASVLENRGELIATLPGKSTDKQSIGLKVILAGKLKEGELEGLVRRFGGTVDRIGPSQWRRAGAVIKGAGRRKPDREKAEISKRQTAAPGRLDGASVDALVMDGLRVDSEHTEPDLGGLSEFQAVVAPSTGEDSIQSLSQSVRVDLSHIDEVSGLAHELYIEVERLSWMAGRMMQMTQVGPKERFDLKQSSRRIERRFLELEERLVEFRMVSLAQTFSKAGRLAERLARDLGKKVEVTLAGRGTQIDKMIVDQIGGPIYH